jgi:hypothetical protein
MWARVLVRVYGRHAPIVGVLRAVHVAEVDHVASMRVALTLPLRVNLKRQRAPLVLSVMMCAPGAT